MKTTFCIILLLSLSSCLTMNRIEKMQAQAKGVAEISDMEVVERNNRYLLGGIQVGMVSNSSSGMRIDPGFGFHYGMIEQFGLSAKYAYPVKINLMSESTNIPKSNKHQFELTLDRPLFTINSDKDRPIPLSTNIPNTLYYTIVKTRRKHSAGVIGGIGSIYNGLNVRNLEVPISAVPPQYQYTENVTFDNYQSSTYLKFGVNYSLTEMTTLYATAKEFGTVEGSSKFIVKADLSLLVGLSTTVDEQSMEYAFYESSSGSLYYGTEDFSPADYMEQRKIGFAAGVTFLSLNNFGTESFIQFQISPGYAQNAKQLTSTVFGFRIGIGKIKR